MPCSAHLCPSVLRFSRCFYRKDHYLDSVMCLSGTPHILERDGDQLRLELRRGKQNKKLRTF